MSEPLSIDELLDLVQEEAAEIIVAASKCKRFGLIVDFWGPKWSDRDKERINRAIARHRSR